MLPTEDDSYLGISTEKVGLSYDETMHDSDVVHQCFHLYILSDDEIKKGDWYYSHDVNGKLLGVQQFISFKTFGDKKIIATTDPKLVFKKENDEYNGYNLIPQVPQSLVKHYAKHQPEEVELEYDEITRKDALVKLYSLKLQNNKVVWVERGCFVPEDVNYNPVTHDLDKPKTYTREEVEELLMKALTHGRYNMTNDVKHHLSSSREWLKENL